VIGSVIAMAKHIGVDITVQDFETYGYHIPLLVNVQPAGEWLCEEYHRAGGLPGMWSRRQGLCRKGNPLTMSAYA
jgi:dihydroxyacid dehydratase/phosphogluconate dehydratase